MTLKEVKEFFTYIRNNPTGESDTELVEEGKKIFDVAIDAMKKYEIMQNEYNERLKSDLAAMLTGILLEFEEELYCDKQCKNCKESCEDIPAGWFIEFIQKKIDNLKA